MKKAGNEDWQHCSAEVIKGMVANSHRESRRAMLKRLGITTAGLFSVVAGGTFWWASRPPTRDEVIIRVTRPIGCPEVMANLAAWHESQLDDALNRRIRCHLSQCQHCNQKYLEMYPEASAQFRRRPAIFWQDVTSNKLSNGRRLTSN